MIAPQKRKQTKKTKKAAVVSQGGFATS